MVHLGKTYGIILTMNSCNIGSVWKIPCPPNNSEIEISLDYFKYGAASASY